MLFYLKAQRWPSHQRILLLTPHTLLFVTIDLASAVVIHTSFKAPDHFPIFAFVAAPCITYRNVGEHSLWYHTGPPLGPTNPTSKDPVTEPTFIGFQF